jgi:hypothetical protein
VERLAGGVEFTFYNFQEPIVPKSRCLYPVEVSVREKTIGSRPDSFSTNPLVGRQKGGKQTRVPLNSLAGTCIAYLWEGPLYCRQRAAWIPVAL